MKIDRNILDITQRNALSLVKLYASYGYTQYKMSKFEEYDLYSKNKGFLVNDSVITFTDTDGKLMALKPDVTLSIIKNTDSVSDRIEKQYYFESVYRVSKHTGCFKEVMQVGLECFGDVDDYNICEVLLLAAKSMKELTEKYILEVSHLGIMSACIRRITEDEKLAKSIWRSVNDKNLHSIAALCRENGIEEESLALLKKVLSFSGAPKSILPQLSALAPELGVETEVEELKNALAVFDNTAFEERILIDFSAVGNTNYYNGIIFNGFVDGVPESVLSGGQYDALMRKMKKDAKAIGFAVYLDLLERLETDDECFDVDVLLVYAPESTVAEVSSAVNAFLAQGKSVFAAGADDGKRTAKEYYYLRKGRLSAIENNA